MTTENVRDVAVVALIAIAPLAIVLMTALFRSYTIDLHMTRDVRRRRRDHDHDDGD